MTNSTIDINESTIKNYVESLRPENLEIREQMDIGYSYDGKVVILFEIRPDWNDAKKKQQFDFAKIRYYKSRKKMEFILDASKWKMGDLRTISRIYLFRQNNRNNKRR